MRRFGLLDAACQKQHRRSDAHMKWRRTVTSEGRRQRWVHQWKARSRTEMPPFRIRKQNTGRRSALRMAEQLVGAMFTRYRGNVGKKDAGQATSIEVQPHLPLALKLHPHAVQNTMSRQVGGVCAVFVNTKVLRSMPQALNSSAKVRLLAMQAAFSVSKTCFAALSIFSLSSGESFCV